MRYELCSFVKVAQSLVPEGCKFNLLYTPDGYVVVIVSEDNYTIFRKDYDMFFGGKDKTCKQILKDIQEIDPLVNSPLAKALR
jgi:hypothetical protein